MSMDNDPLDKLFKDMPSATPDSERKKESLNLAVSAFEARKSAISEKSSKAAQGNGWLARLISQFTTERKDKMEKSSRNLVIGGLMTACGALLIALPMTYDNMRNTISDGGALVEAPKIKAMTLDVERSDVGTAESLAAGSSVDDAASLQSQVVANVEVKEESFAAKRMAAAPMPAAPPSVGIAADAFAPVMQVEGRDRFEHKDENSVMQVKQEPVSTFSIDVDTASYSFVRQSLDNGILPQKDAVRVEEMINYFDYAYPGPQTAEEPFKTTVVVKPSPWNEGRKLMTIGIKGFDAQKSEAPDSNLVFLIDTSGSMNEPKKLPLLKQSLSMLLDSLKPTDKVSIVVYAGSAGTILQPTEVSKKNDILQALNNLNAGGSTAGGEGIRLAYQLAQSNFNEKAVNRVILATDGDFNVGITEPDELQGFIEREREKGIFLSVLGFGTGNYNDELMQKLAQNGNGVAAYIDTLNEARKVLVQEASATLFPIAKDVKIQVEFNPATVSEYRLVGYETRALATEDFNNDKVDAGDIGAGAEVTAIYEVTPKGVAPLVDESRYGDKIANQPLPNKGDELAFVKVRYKLPKESTSKLTTTPVLADHAALDETVLRETNWAEAVAGFAQLLKGGEFTGKLTYDDVLKQANANRGEDPFGYRAEFINLIYKAKTAASMPQQGGQPGGYYE